MDPNASLEEIRRLIFLVRTHEVLMPAEASDALDRITDLFKALDEWIVGGGFLPEAWQRKD